jgi:hypothetical protein
MSNYSELKSYIDQSDENLNRINTDESLSSDDKATLVYEIYANFIDLEDELKHIRRDMRKQFKIKDEAVKKWMKESEPEADEKIEE